MPASNPLSRSQADELVAEYDDARDEYALVRRIHRLGAVVDTAFFRMNAERERLLDALSGEEATEPLAGNAP